MAQKLTFTAAIISGAIIIVVTALVLFAMGRVPICECGTIRLWSGYLPTSEMSQQISDIYTFSHIIHGIAFFWIFWLARKRLHISIPLAFVFAIFIESAWEIFENTSFIINRYREATISLDYFGDSILNSISDIFAMVLGFVFAWRFPGWVSVAIILFIELGMLYLIRDNLTLNILMLIYPFEIIKAWQIGI